MEGPQNPGKRLYETIWIPNQRMPKLIFEMVQHVLEEFGALVVELFQTFPGFDDDDDKLRSLPR